MKAPRPSDALGVLAVLALDYAVKSFAAHANARELQPLLAPTAALVTRFTGRTFTFESGSGYVSRDLFVVIAPVCSGANFAIVAFTALGLGFLPRLRTVFHKTAWLGASAALAYAATVLANALRITLALTLGRELAARHLLSPEAAHRAVGVGVYLVCLLGMYALAGRCFEPRLDGRRASLGLLPLGSYVAVTVLTPILHGTAHGAFWTHAGVVAGAAGFAIGVLWLLVRFAAWSKRTLGSVVEGTLGPNGVRFGVDVAQRRSERSLPG